MAYRCDEGVVQGCVFGYLPLDVQLALFYMEVVGLSPCCGVCIRADLVGGAHLYPSHHMFPAPSS